MANRTPCQGLTLKEIKERVTAQLASGLGTDSIIRQLIERGWPEETARRFVTSAMPALGVMREQAMERRTTLKDDLRRMLRGLICVILGFVVIAVGLGMRDVGNGIFHFTMGVLLIVFEAHDFAAGFGGWLQHRK
jgi:hypothetical protein